MAAKLEAGDDRDWLDIKLPSDVLDRLDRTADRLGVRPRELARRIIVDHLGDYEERENRTLVPASGRSRNRSTQSASFPLRGQAGCRCPADPPGRLQ